MALELSGFFRYRSALPYNIYNATLADTNHDGFSGDLAPGQSHVNGGRGASSSQFDLRISRDFVFAADFGVELIVEAFNVFNSKNAATFDRFGNPQAFAGDPLQGEQRLAQVGLRIHF